MSKRRRFKGYDFLTYEDERELSRRIKLKLMRCLRRNENCDDLTPDSLDELVLERLYQTQREHFSMEIQCHEEDRGPVLLVVHTLGRDDDTYLGDPDPFKRQVDLLTLIKDTHLWGKGDKAKLLKTLEQAIKLVQDIVPFDDQPPSPAYVPKPPPEWEGVDE